MLIKQEGVQLRLIVLLMIGIIVLARKDRALLTLAIAAPILLAVQIVLGGLTVL